MYLENENIALFRSLMILPTLVHKHLVPLGPTRSRRQHTITALSFERTFRQFDSPHSRATQSNG